MDFFHSSGFANARRHVEVHYERNKQRPFRSKNGIFPGVFSLLHPRPAPCWKFLLESKQRFYLITSDSSTAEHLPPPHPAPSPARSWRHCAHSDFRCNSHSPPPVIAAPAPPRCCPSRPPR